MTTPAQDAPLVFPSVAFRPIRLLVICAALTGIAVLAASSIGRPLFGVFFGVGLGLGLLNSLMVRRAVESITAEEHPLKKKMAVNSMTRLLVVTAVGVAIAFAFKPVGIAALFGVALFQPLLVMSTAIPVMKKIRANGLDVQASESKD